MNSQMDLGILYNNILSLILSGGRNQRLKPEVNTRGPNHRDYTERWPLLTVETEVNGDSKSKNARVLPCLVRWACHVGARDFGSALGALVGLVQNNFSLRTLFQFLCPYRPACWALGRQPC
jgi:hypothetical protein